MEREEVTWLEFAKTDLAVAEHLYKEFHPKPLEIICYHCQQAAEKAIKAIIVSNGAQGGMPKKHNLSFLLEQLKNTLEISETYRDYANVLTPYGIITRYPNGLHIEERNAQEALQYASEILQWSEEMVEQHNEHAK